MNKKLKWLLLTPLVFSAASGLTSCAKSDNYLLLRVINSEDYIYLQEDDEEPEDLVIQFEKSDAVAAFLEAKEAEGKHYEGVRVIYDTSDTNETLYSELQTGKSNYDLMNVSDYMAQKIVSAQMAVPLYQNGLTIPNYEQFSSSGETSIKYRLDNIEAIQKIYDENEHRVVDHVVKLKDYAVGYMWGTLGILFNPEYPGFGDIPSATVIEDMQSVEAFWDTKYNGTISIKNSMRDTYALGVLYTYRDEFQELATKYANNEINLEEYKAQFDLVFNRCEENQVNEVRESLESLKKNIFGLEVDSGKQDIITKKIGINLAWSGDAVYSMDQAEDPNEVSEPIELCYAVPELGSNVWMDTWIMPDCARSEDQYELAHLFLDFLSDPANAAQNMAYTGYTSFIGGDDILSLVREWYDVRAEEVSYTDEDENSYSIYSVNSTDYALIDYADCLADRDAARNDEELVYFIPYEEEVEQDGELVTVTVEEPKDLEDLLANSEALMIEDDEGNEVQKHYRDLLIVNDADSEYEEVDLSYFFNGTLDELQDNIDTVFYSDCYLPYENEDGTHNISVGRQFFCQYPTEETLNRCAVMKDYGENNKYVMKMWENFKSDALPTWATTLFIIIIVSGLGLIAYFVVNSVLKKQLKKKRKENK